MVLNNDVETCSLILRLTEDFGDDTLPFQGGYFAASRGARTASVTFENIVIRFRSLVSWINASKSSVWSGPQRESETDLTLIFAPLSSPFNQHWGYRMGRSSLLSGLGELSPVGMGNLTLPLFNGSTGFENAVGVAKG